MLSRMLDLPLPLRPVIELKDSSLHHQIKSQLDNHNRNNKCARRGVRKIDPVNITQCWLLTTQI